METEDFLLVAVVEEEKDDEYEAIRGPGPSGRNRSHKRTSKLIQVPVQQLAENTQEFFASIDRVLSAVRTQISEYELDEVEISASISASGKLTLLGNGAELEGTGSIKFVLKKKKTQG